MSSFWDSGLAVGVACQAFRVRRYPFSAPHTAWKEAFVFSGSWLDVIGIFIWSGLAVYTVADVVVFLFLS